jgi:hypothetical protein
MLSGSADINIKHEAIEAEQLRHPHRESLPHYTTTAPSPERPFTRVR